VEIDVRRRIGGGTKILARKEDVVAERRKHHIFCRPCFKIVFISTKKGR